MGWIAQLLPVQRSAEGNPTAVQTVVEAQATPPRSPVGLRGLGVDWITQLGLALALASLLPRTAAQRTTMQTAARRRPVFMRSRPLLALRCPTVPPRHASWLSLETAV